MSPTQAQTGPAAAPSEADAQLAVALLRELSADLRGCAVLGRDGEVLAASGDPRRWQRAGAGLLAAADGAGGEPALQVHVATEDGEAFAVREGELALVAVSERFALASLMLLDMRSVLRDLAAGEAGRDRRAPGAAAHAEAAAGADPLAEEDD